MNKNNFEHPDSDLPEDFIRDLREGYSSGVPEHPQRQPEEELPPSIVTDPQRALEAQLQTLRELAAKDPYFQQMVDELERQYPPDREEI